MLHLTESLVSLLTEYEARIHQNKITSKKAQIEAAGHSYDSRMRVYLWPDQPRKSDARGIKFSLDGIKPWALPLISEKCPSKQNGMVRRTDGYEEACPSSGYHGPGSIRPAQQTRSARIQTSLCLNIGIGPEIILPGKTLKTGTTIPVFRKSFY